MPSSSALMPVLSRMQPNGGTMTDDRRSDFLRRST